MSNPGPNAPRQTDRWLEPGPTNALVIYILYLAGLVIGVTGIVGIVLAYIKPRQGRGFVEGQLHIPDPHLLGSACSTR